MTSSPRAQWCPGDGEEPDPRWSLANERTLLAYSRTALALVVVAGLAVAGSHAVTDVPVRLAAVGSPITMLGVVVAVAGRCQFLATQRAMRLGQALPVPLVASLLPWGVATIAAAGLVVVVALALAD